MVQLNKKVKDFVRFCLNGLPQNFSKNSVIDSRNKFKIIN